MGIRESGENYLETILLLEKKNGTVRSVDIANELEYSKPSISRAMGILKENGYIIIAANGDIQLTEKGRGCAIGIYERHRLIADFFIIALGVDEKTADEDACRIEHVISEESFERIRDWVKNQSFSGRA
ncbi:MAG TPA: metal-dependent transcriptional regulator [Bacillota bacterium]|jgi:Mn-dependent DtxR family transcriptional regulator|nr:metal-dependent transcriptional regulator [Bacillota bacterium]